MAVLYMVLSCILANQCAENKKKNWQIPDRDGGEIKAVQGVHPM